MTIALKSKKKRNFLNYRIEHNLLKLNKKKFTGHSSNSEIFSVMASKASKRTISRWKKLLDLASVVIAIPATSVPSERFFSHAGYQLWDGNNSIYLFGPRSNF
ncbi:hypothetical protein BpHYR1_003548 [Brachionus plicatilis]|uniref:HAT C-terminal dimerisation domain-containing protein n=1 Tax=Brachionus plicatilis TaxID=10195 RepID=A0A3M7QDV2_BRAPC|nr:hypothetical protein BpHYR1_003548 [Brachionus plicatilis]